MSLGRLDCTTRRTHDHTTRHDTTRHDTTRHDTTRHDTTRHDTRSHTMRAFYERSSNVPACPVCHGRHHTATNGAGRRVHCDGSPAETEDEQQAREDEQRFALARESARKLGLLEEQQEERATKRREQRARTKRRDAIRAEKTARADAPAIDAIDIGRLPDRW